MAFVIDREFEIAAPADVVWEVLIDFACYPQWNSFLLECSSSLQPGDPIDLRVKLGARPQMQREWMTEHLPGKRFAYRMKPAPLGALSSERSHDVQALGQQRSRYRSYFRLDGWLTPLLRALLGRRLEAGFSSMNEGAKRRAENLWNQRRAKAP